MTRVIKPTGDIGSLCAKKLHQITSRHVADCSRVGYGAFAPCPTSSTGSKWVPLDAPQGCPKKEYRGKNPLTRRRTILWAHSPPRAIVFLAPQGYMPFLRFSFNFRFTQIFEAGVLQKFFQDFLFDLSFAHGEGSVRACPQADIFEEPPLRGAIHLSRGGRAPRRAESIAQSSLSAQG